MSDRPVAPAPTTGDQRGPIAGLRAGLVLVCVALSILPPAHVAALPVLLVLLVGAVASYRSPRLSRSWPHVGAVLAAGAAASTGGARSPLLPYLLAPGLVLGLVATQRQVVLAGGSAAGAFLVGGAVAGELGSPGYAAAGAQWVLLLVAVGLMVLWARRVASRPEDGFDEVRHLLRQLRGATHQLPGGLDAPATAEILLDRCHAVVAEARSAVLVQPGDGGLVPLAVRGSRRVPWRTHLDEAGPLRDAWTTGTPSLDVRASDPDGSRRGSAVAVVPFASDGSPFGLLVVESHDVTAFTPEVLDSLQRTAAAASTQLEAAVLFAEVRAVATLEERGRLARDMHDGVAQELAVLGYQLDELVACAAAVDGDLGERAAGVRKDLTQLITGIRLSIFDLRTNITAERGLGAVVGSHLRALCTEKGIVLHLSLEESAFRLAAEGEVLLCSAMHLFTQPLRHTSRTRNLWVTLRVDPPSASLRVEHDGCTDQPSLGDLESAARALGGTLRSEVSPAAGAVLEVVLGQGADGHVPVRPGPDVGNHSRMADVRQPT